MTSWPCSASSAAATDESTPPDIATTMRIVRLDCCHEVTKTRDLSFVSVSSWPCSSCRRCSSASGPAASRRAAAARRPRGRLRPRSRTVPRLKRSEFCVRCAGKPIARSTCDGSSVPDEQAEPVDTATPSRSSAMSRLSASTRSKLMFVVFGTRGCARAVDRRARHARAECPLRADRAARRRARASAAIFAGRERARRRPGRRWPARSRCPRAGCARACRRSGSAACRVPRLIHSAPAPFGPSNLCAGQRQQVDAERAHVDRNLADRLHGVGVHQRAALVRDRARARRPAESCRSRCWRA